MDTRDETGHAEVIVKTMAPALLNPAGTVSGQYGEIPWPFDPLALLQLYVASAEHQAAIHLKSEGAFGGGVNDSSKALDDVCEEGAAELFVSLDVDAETYGNAFLQVIRSGERIVELRRLPAIGMKRRAAGGYIQVIQDAFGREQVSYFRRDEIVHIRPPCPMGGFYSLPTWASASGFIELIASAVEYNKRFFDNSAMPEYVFIVKGGQLTTAQKQAARQFFSDNYKGLDNSHKTLFLQFDGSDVEVELKRATAEVKDGDFVKMLDSARDRIPIAHRVPPRMLGIAASGQLGGGGEVSTQLHYFETLVLNRKRMRMLGQCRKVLAALSIDPADAGFVPLDLTPPQDDREHLADWVNAGMLTPEQAAEMAKSADSPTRRLIAALRAL